MSPVRVRPPRATDREPFLALTRGSEALHRPWVTPPVDAGGFARYLERAAGERHESLMVLEGEELVGAIDMSEIVRGAFQSAYLSYFVGAMHARRGLMTAGMRLAVDHAFGALGLHRLEANIQPNNAASIALVRRCGFRREGFSPRYLKIGGRWRDHERWAILADDPR